jgi:hypothetical protein
MAGAIKGIVLAAFALGMLGCRGNQEVPFARYAQPVETPILNASSSNGFDTVALAGEDAIVLAGTLGTRPEISIPNREKLKGSLRRPLDRIAAAVARPSVYRFAPHHPLRPPKRRLGWDLLGRVLAWRIEDSCAEGNYDAAIRDVGTALRFGFLLTGGDVTDATIGLSIVDGARKAIAPSLDTMGAGQLGTLAQTVWGALEGKPLLNQAYDNELQNALTMVDAVQEAHRMGEMKPFYEAMSADGDIAQSRLGEIKPESEKRKAFFDGLADEARAEHAWLSSKVRIPAVRREMEEPPKRNRFRPWLLFSRHFVMVGRRLLAQNDVTLARTRLLAIEAIALRQVKATGLAPRSLEGVPEFGRQDPFNGRTLGFRSIGQDFVAYSVGSNFTDEAGDTDINYAEPDLRVERPVL